MKKAHPIIHDGCYISNDRNFFEWWYFDFDLVNDYRIYIVWHNPLFCLKESYATLIVRIYSPDNNVVDKNVALGKTNWMKVYRYHRSLVCQSEDKCDISFPSGYIKEVGKNYVISIIERDLYIHLELERLLLPLSIQDNLVYRSKNGKEYLKWYIPLPRATARGKIGIYGKHIEAEGTAYHDHNWGNLNLKKYLRSWVWGRVFFNNFTFIFADVQTNTPGEKFQVLLFVEQDGNCIDAAPFDVHYRGFDDQNQYRIRTPNVFLFEFGDGKKYRTNLWEKRKLVIEEAPFGSFDKNFVNVLLAKSYYAFRLYHAPNGFKKWFGRLIYFQSEVIAELYKNDTIEDRQTGNIEVMRFAD